MQEAPTRYSFVVGRCRCRSRWRCRHRQQSQLAGLNHQSSSTATEPAGTSPAAMRRAAGWRPPRNPPGLPPAPLRRQPLQCGSSAWQPCRQSLSPLEGSSAGRWGDGAEERARIAISRARHVATMAHTLCCAVRHRARRRETHRERHTQRERQRERHTERDRGAVEGDLLS